MVAMGETRRDGVVKKDKKKSEKATVAAKEPQPVVLKLRLFVGGLGPSVVAADLRQRFAPLGTVHKIDLVEGRKGCDPADASQRGFAYVDFEAASEASLRKLFSAYNGCKWKGGVLRVEKAKEHYTDRLRREWVEAEAEAAVKAKIAAKAAAMAVAPSRDMYSFTPDYDIGSRSPENDRVELEQGDADAMAVDTDLVAAQIEKERRGHLDLLSKLFPADKDAVDEEEKIVEIVKLRAFPLPDANAKKRKLALENASEVASSSAPPNEDDSGVAGAEDTNDRQKTKTRRVKFSEEAMDDEKVKTKMATKPILKKAREDSKNMDVDEEEEEEEDEEEREYYLPSRSPSPEGGLSDESKWQRLFKYAGLEKGPEAANPSTGLYTGINLDDEDDEEPAVAAVIENPQRGDGMFSGVLSEEEEEEPQQSTLGSEATDSVVSKKTNQKKIPVTTDGVGSDGIFSGILSDPEEEEEQLQVQDSVAATEDPELSPDQGEELSDFEDANEDLQDTKSSEEEDEEEEDEEEEDEEEDDEEDDFVDAASTMKSLTPTPLSDAARASKWAKMFNSASTAAETVDGAFSGSLDAVDVPARARPAVKVQRMFESAAADQTSEVPTASDKIVASDEAAIRQSPEEEDASTNSEDDFAETENKHVTDDREEDATDLEQTGTAGGNLLARFNMEQDEVSPSSVSNIPPETKPVDENTKWMQRASWKSLMGAEGRAAFSLKQVTGESEAPKATTDEKKEAPATFSFTFTRNAPEATTSRVNTKVPKPLDKAAKVADDEAGCSFMKSADADKEWRASKNELRIDSKAKHKAAVRKMKKMKGSGGAR